MKLGILLRAALGVAVMATAAAVWGGQGNERMSDHQFLNEAARGSLAEMTLGQMAETKARNPRVKEFASRRIAGSTSSSSAIHRETATSS